MATGSVFDVKSAIDCLQNIKYVGLLTDLNYPTTTAATFHFGAYSQTASNRPDSGGGDFIVATSDTSSWGCQLVFSDKGVYARRLANDTYGTWKTIVTL